MILRPLQDRVLILPQPPVEQTASGLAVVEHRKPEQVGTVVAVGLQVHPRKAEAEALAIEVAAIKYHVVGVVRNAEGDTTPLRSLADRQQVLAAGAELLRDLVRREPLVKVGDQVLFSWLAGQELLDADDDVRYLLMREEDLLAVIED